MLNTLRCWLSNLNDTKVHVQVKWGSDLLMEHLFIDLTTDRDESRPLAAKLDFSKAEPYHRVYPLGAPFECAIRNSLP